MTMMHTNRKGKTYYLHQGITKKGNPKYFFALRDEGDLVETIPPGYEIYENPNAQVFLRRIRPQIVTAVVVAIVLIYYIQFTVNSYFCDDVEKRKMINKCFFLGAQILAVILNLTSYSSTRVALKLSSISQGIWGWFLFFLSIRKTEPVSGSASGILPGITGSGKGIVVREWNTAEEKAEEALRQIQILNEKHREKTQRSD